MLSSLQILANLPKRLDLNKEMFPTQWPARQRFTSGCTLQWDELSTSWTQERLPQ